MKQLIVAFLATLALNITPTLAQNKSSNTASSTFKVEGVCGACKKRIENAAYLPGVKLAEWNKETSELTVVFNPKKTTQENIEKEIAAKGHTTANVKADRDTYEKLPACCAYETNHKH